MTEPEASEQYQPDRGEENIHHYTTEYAAFGQQNGGELHIPDPTQKLLTGGAKSRDFYLF